MHPMRPMHRNPRIAHEINTSPTSASPMRIVQRYSLEVLDLADHFSRSVCIRLTSARSGARSANFSMPSCSSWPCSEVTSSAFLKCAASVWSSDTAGFLKASPTPFISSPSSKLSNCVAIGDSFAWTCVARVIFCLRFFSASLTLCCRAFEQSTNQSTNLGTNHPAHQPTLPPTQPPTRPPSAHAPAPPSVV